MELGWYQWVYYRYDTTSFYLPEEEIGKYLGTSDNIGSKMSMWILKQNGEIVSRTTLRTLTDSELASETVTTKIYVFTKAFNKNIGPTLCDIGIKSDLGESLMMQIRLASLPT